MKASILSKDLNGISFVNKILDFEGEKVSFQIWDNTFSKQSSYYSSCYLRGCICCIIICDISRKNCEGELRGRPNRKTTWVLGWSSWTKKTSKWRAAWSLRTKWTWSPTLRCSETEPTSSSWFAIISTSQTFTFVRSKRTLPKKSKTFFWKSANRFGKISSAIRDILKSLR